MHDDVKTLRAVKKNGWALRFVKKQTPEICRAALCQNLCAIAFVDYDLLPEFVQVGTN